MEEIASIKTEDNIVFSQVKVDTLPIHHRKLPGYRVSIQGQLGQIRNKISIDVGAGDVVDSKKLEVKLMQSKTPLFEESISLKSYTPEYIFSEKIEAILYLGESNSRMKNFYDCYRLIEENIMSENFLKTALYTTTKHRGTKLEKIPRPDKQLEVRWKSFVKKNGVSDLELFDIVSKINDKLSIIIKKRHKI